MEYQIGHYQELPQYQKLEDIGLPADGIEDGIANLVRALQAIRVGTHASCEGHLDHGHKHPWVGFNPFSIAKIVALKHLVNGYNEEHEIEWTVDKNWLSTNAYQYACCEYVHNPDERKRMSRNRLRILQESADQLANYIFDHRKDDDIKELILIRGL